MTTSDLDGAEDVVAIVQRVARCVPGLPWITVLDAVEDSTRQTCGAPYQSVTVEAVAVAKLRTSHGLLAA